MNFQTRNPEFVVWFRKVELDKPESYNGWTAFLPHWLVLSIWLTASAVLLLWRYGRIRRFSAMLRQGQAHPDQ